MKKEKAESKKQKGESRKEKHEFICFLLSAYCLLIDRCNSRKLFPLKILKHRAASG